MYSEIRAAQMAAYLLLKSDGQMAYIRLLKLLYLAERRAMARWGDSISGDHFVSMPKGPVLSQTYDLIKGDSSDSPWNTLIKGERNYEVSVLDGIGIDDLDELSKAELDILQITIDEFGHMSSFEIVQFTHDNCSEWQDPQGSSYPISPESVFRAMGKNVAQIKALLEKHREQSQLESAKANLV